MVQLAVLSPSTGLRSLHALDLELAAPGALPLAPRLWRLPRDLDTPPPSVAALLQPLARSTTLPGLLDGLSESPPAPTLRPWRLHFEAHALFRVDDLIHHGRQDVEFADRFGVVVGTRQEDRSEQEGSGSGHENL